MAASGSERMFVVTTRSRLRSPLFFPSMLLASLRIRRQLARNDEVRGWASIVAGPSEFWTITVWDSRHEMHEFMRSGAHEDIMWLFGRWLRSFWLMRWRPGPDELGTWRGVRLAAPDPPQAAPAGGGAAREQALKQVLSHLPRLAAATGADGAARYEHSPMARRRRAEVGTTGGAIVHIRTSPLATLPAALALRRLRRALHGRGVLLRSALGVGRPGEVYLLGVWRDREDVRRLFDSAELAGLAQRWPGFWAGEWVPENEFGHWDGLRVRRARDRRGIPVPGHAAAALDPEHGGPGHGRRRWRGRDTRMATSRGEPR